MDKIFVDHQTFSLLCKVRGIFINLLFILFSYKSEFEFRKKESRISSINLTKVIKSKTLFLWIQECQTHFIIHFEFKLPLNNLFPFILHYKKNALTEFENLMMGFREQLFPEEVRVVHFNKIFVLTIKYNFDKWYIVQQYPKLYLD